MKICFIGGGNMANAMIGGLLRNGTCRPGDIRVVEISDESRQRFEAQGIVVFPTQERNAMGDADVIVLAVKPQQMRAVGIQLGPELSANQVV